MQPEYYLRFPSVLKDALSKGMVEFSEATEFEYKPLLVYRGITREKEDKTPINRGDFLSYAE